MGRMSMGRIHFHHNNSPRPSVTHRKLEGMLEILHVSLERLNPAQILLGFVLFIAIVYFHFCATWRSFAWWTGKKIPQKNKNVPGAMQIVRHNLAHWWMLILIQLALICRCGLRTSLHTNSSSIASGVPRVAWSTNKIIHCKGADQRQWRSLIA